MSFFRSTTTSAMTAFYVANCLEVQRLPLDVQALQLPVAREAPEEEGGSSFLQFKPVCFGFIPGVVAEGCLCGGCASVGFVAREYQKLRDERQKLRDEEQKLRDERQLERYGNGDPKQTELKTDVLSGPEEGLGQARTEGAGGSNLPTVGDKVRIEGANKKHLIKYFLQESDPDAGDGENQATVEDPQGQITAIHNEGNVTEALVKFVDVVNGKEKYAYITLTHLVKMDQEKK